MKGYKDQMEKIFISKCCKKQFWFVFFLLCLFTFFSHYLALLAAKNGITLLSYFPSTRDPCPTTMNFTDNPVSDKKDNRPKQVQDSCLGQYIYVHDLPSRFNVDILKNCSSLIKWFSMCESLTNFGLGPEVKNSGNVLQNTSWYVTNQFVLEIIFHEKMKCYKCLTNDSSLASAVFVPYYAGLDVGRYLWDGYNTSVRDANPLELTKWLAKKPEWRKMEGRDHFFVAGRVSWDFNRQSGNNSDWGNRLMSLPEVKNMTMLIIESRPWGDNEFAVPYPTYFHPSTESEIFEWQQKVQNSKRPYLFSFVGAPRPKMLNSIRESIINQCLASGRKCKLLDCKVKSCDNPIHLMKMFQQSRFCLQPSGDSYTRRSTFDSILAGCIPVFFHPGSAYIQYMWHLPKNHRKYSVFIPEEGLRNGTVNIEEILGGISEDEVAVMREEVIRLIPRVIYSDPRSSLGTVDDAFDIAVRKVVERIEGISSKMKGRGNSSVDFLEPKKIGSEWEHFF